MFIPKKKLNQINQSLVMFTKKFIKKKLSKNHFSKIAIKFFLNI